MAPRPPVMQPFNGHQAERNAEIMRRHLFDGARKVDLAREYGLSASRIDQLIEREIRRARREAYLAEHNRPRIVFKVSYPDDDSWMVG